ncbi:MAG: hypothetical protein ACI81V_000850 [Lentimonas sp.]|jgi:hypothetical protein
MKIGILTFHEVFNPGAFLQAYATQKMLSEAGHDVQIINYNPPRHRYHPIKHLLRLHLRFPFCLSYWNQCRKSDATYKLARQKHFKLTRFFERREALQEERFDLVVVGADIVWNYQMKRLGCDPVYFGACVNTRRLIAFAPSAGSCSPAGEIPDYVSQNLPNFNAISVRDANTAELVKKAIGAEVPVLCDPTFHLKGFVRSHATPRQPQRDERILVYLLHGLASPELIRQVRALSAQTGLPIHAVLYGYSWADENIMDLDPFEWIEAIRHARYFVTNTFHGTVFSLLTAANVVVELNDAIFNKTHALLEGVSFGGRLFVADSQLAELFSNQLPTDRVDAYLNQEAKRSEAYLMDQLEQAELDCGERRLS